MPVTYLHFDGQTHRAGEDDRTATGELVPFGAGWSYEQGDGPACPACFPDEPKAEKNQPAAKSKAKAKKG